MDRVYELEEQLAEKEQQLAEKEQELAEKEASSGQVQRTVDELIGEGKEGQDMPLIEPVQYVQPVEGSFAVGFEDVQFEDLSYGFDYEHVF